MHKLQAHRTEPRSDRGHGKRKLRSILVKSNTSTKTARNRSIQSHRNRSKQQLIVDSAKMLPSWSSTAIFERTVFPSLSEIDRSCKRKKRSLPTDPTSPKRTHLNKKEDTNKSSHPCLVAATQTSRTSVAALLPLSRKQQTDHEGQLDLKCSLLRVMYVCTCLYEYPDQTHTHSLLSPAHSRLASGNPSNLLSFNSLSQPFRNSPNQRPASRVAKTVA